MESFPAFPCTLSPSSSEESSSRPHSTSKAEDMVIDKVSVERKFK